MSCKHNQTVTFGAKNVIINDIEAGKKQAAVALQLLVIIVVTKYCTLTARFLNARLLKY